MLIKKFVPFPSFRSREERRKVARIITFIVRLTDSWRIQPVYKANTSTVPSAEE